MTPRALKICAAALIGAVVGGFGGWYAGYIHPATTANRRALLVAERLEPEYVGPALIALRTMPLIQSGDTNRATEILADAVADYYRAYAVELGTTDYRKRARTVIEATAQTNVVLAARIERKMTNEPLKDFHRVWVKEWNDYIYVGRFTNSVGRAEPSDAPNDGPATPVGGSDGAGEGRHR
jgi:hypothetical protein